MDRLEEFERMLESVKAQFDQESETMEQLRAAGREKSATYRQLFSNRMVHKAMLDMYCEYGLID